MNKKYKILALFGMSGAGKDTLKEKLLATKGYHKIINSTTRPIRENETDGVDYHFLSVEDFSLSVVNGDFIEAAEFNHWFYGTSIKELSLDEINVGVFNIYGIKCMLDDSRLDVIPVYVEASDKTRLLRALNREQNPNCDEICRRYIADKKDFEKIDFDYYTFDNNNNGNSLSTIDNILRMSALGYLY